MTHVSFYAVQVFTRICFKNLRPSVASLPADAPPFMAALLARCWAALQSERPSIEAVCQVPRNRQQGAVTVTVSERHQIAECACACGVFQLLLAL